MAQPLGDYKGPVLGSKPGTPPQPISTPSYPPGPHPADTPSAFTFGAALQFTENDVGGPVVEFESNPTASTTVSVAIDGNGDRVALIIVNMGANDIFIAPSPNVSSTNGIRLGANGGNVTMTVRNDYTLMSRRWYMVAIAGTSAVYILEMSRFAYTKKVGP